MWVNLCSDFASVAEYTMPRRTFSEKTPTELIAFCDASKQAYGFVVYAIQEDMASFFSQNESCAVIFLYSPNLSSLAILLALNCFSKILTYQFLSDQNIKPLHIYRFSNFFNLGSQRPSVKGHLGLSKNSY